jgi:hypothetical protein
VLADHDSPAVRLASEQNMPVQHCHHRRDRGLNFQFQVHQSHCLHLSNIHTLKRQRFETFLTFVSDNKHFILFPPIVANLFLRRYGQDMVAAAMSLPAQHGAFIANCRAHCQSGTPGAWTGTTVNGTAMGVAFVKWYAAIVDNE